MFKREDIKKLNECGLVESNSINNFQKTESEKLNDAKQRKEIHQKLKEMLMEELRVKNQNPKKGIAILDNILNIALLKDKDKSMGISIKNFVMPVLVEQRVIEKSYSSIEFVAEYTVTSDKTILNKVRRCGIDTIEKNHHIDIKKLTKVAIGTTIRYLAMNDEFNNLDLCKEKVAKIFSAIGVLNIDSMINEVGMELFSLRYRTIIAKKNLENFTKDNYEISKMILKRLAEINNKDINVIELLKVDKSGSKSTSNEKELKEDLKVEKKRFETIEIKGEKETVEKKEDVVIVEKRKEEIIETLKFKNKMLSIQLEEIKEELDLLQREKEDNMEYLARRYAEGIKDVVNALNAPEYGCMLDQLYKLSKGTTEIVNPKMLGTNILRALGIIGIRAREVEKFGTEVVLTNKNIHEYRVSRGIESDDDIRGIVDSPAWMYKTEKLINQLLNIEEE